jgi:hypothetical protein
MATPLDTLKLAYGTKTHEKEKSHIPEYNDPMYIKELISKAFATRNLLHFAHWATQSFAMHSAVGSLYDSIIEDIDDIVETYIGKYGQLENLSTGMASVPDDICDHVKQEAKWIQDNRSKIANNCTPIENIIDNLIGSYHKTIYKLENLS